MDRNTLAALSRDDLICVSAWKKDPSVECAPGGGQFQAEALTVC